MIDNKLIQLDACEKARDWAQGKSWPKIYNTCHRGNWALWLFAKTNPDDLRLLTLVKAHCANTVRHLMTDARSINAIDVAIAYGEGKASRIKLDAAANAAANTAASNANIAAYAAATYTAYGANIKPKNRQQTADICRQYLPIEIWNITDEKP